MTWLQPLFYRWVKWRYRKPRWIKKRGLELFLLPTVFHPSIYRSTDIFLDFLLERQIENSTVLELGCGNGFIAMYLAKHKRCVVTASDINPAAIEGLNQGCTKNNIRLTTVSSDLFDKIPKIGFDYILINPPYYNKDVQSVDEHAFFCGAKFEYFTKLFTQITPYLIRVNNVYVILSDSAQLKTINEMAQEHDIEMNIVFQQSSETEVFYIYELHRA